MKIFLVMRNYEIDEIYAPLFGEERQKYFMEHREEELIRRRGLGNVFLKTLNCRIQAQAARRAEREKC
jgi:hypothetical protein